MTSLTSIRDRPEIRYEQGLSPEERERMARGLAAMHERMAQAGSQPPWTVTLEDGSTFTVDPSAPGDEPGSTE